MKSKKRLIVIIGAFVICSHAIEANAISAVSEGTINFTDSTTGQVIKPGTPGGPEDIIEPEQGGKNTTGELKINHVPNFEFGDVTMTAGEMDVKAKVEAYTYKNKPNEKHYVPPFVQVSDYRSTTSGLSLVVSGSKFMSVTGDVLNNTKIRLSQETVLNNVYSNNDLLSKLEGGNFGNGKFIELGSTNASLPILRTINNESVLGTVSSSVFSNSYTKDATYNATDKVDGVRFYKPSGVAVRKEKYTATLTWTLSDVL